MKLTILSGISAIAMLAAAAPAFAAAHTNGAMMTCEEFLALAPADQEAAAMTLATSGQGGAMGAGTTRDTDGSTTGTAASGATDSGAASTDSTSTGTMATDAPTTDMQSDATANSDGTATMDGTMPSDGTSDATASSDGSMATDNTASTDAPATDSATSTDGGATTSADVTSGSMDSTSSDTVMAVVAICTNTGSATN